METLTDSSCASQLAAAVATADPGMSCWERAGLGEDRWYYVLEGELEVRVGEVSHLLTAGDSIYLEASNSHIWRNPGSKRAKALVLSSPPNGVNIPS